MSELDTLEPEVMPIAQLTAEHITPIGPYVLVRRRPVATKVSPDSLIYLPETHEEKSLYCDVLKVGPGEVVAGQLVKAPIAPGDVVLIRQFDGRKVDMAGKLTLVHQELIEGKVVDAPWPMERERPEQG